MRLSLNSALSLPRSVLRWAFGRRGGLLIRRGFVAALE